MKQNWDYFVFINYEFLYACILDSLKSEKI